MREVLSREQKARLYAACRFGGKLTLSAAWYPGSCALRLALATVGAAGIAGITAGIIFGVPLSIATGERTINWYKNNPMYLFADTMLLRGLRK